MKTKIMEKEVKVKEVALNYLKNASKHTFQSKNVWDKEYGNYNYKLFPVVLNEKQGYISMSFNEEDIKFKFKSIEWVTNKRAIGDMKNSAFPQYKKHKSIRQNKVLKEKFNKINDFINNNHGISQDELQIKMREIMNIK